MKNNIILNITTFCNYSCSYCDVLKNNKQLSKQNIESILSFIKNNKKNIGDFKFFGGEPLLVFDKIKYIIDNSKEYIGYNYTIVTNTSLLNDEIGYYFNKYFKIIFFSIDTENYFDFKKVGNVIKKYNLEKKLYFNLIINPSEEKKSLKQFKKLYNLGFRGFNILPVYLTKPRTSKELKNLSEVMKYIIDLSLQDNNIRLYGFQKKETEKSKLINNSFFIDIDGKVYYSDIVSCNFGNNIKKELFLGDINEINLEKLQNKNLGNNYEIISELEKNIYDSVDGQKQLCKIMDYFSEYLNIKNAK